MVKSHYEMARTLSAERDAAVHTSRVVASMPDHGPVPGDHELSLELSLELMESVAAYLSSLGDLEEAMADQLEIILKHLPFAEGNE